MAIERTQADLEKIQRPFSHLFQPKEGDAYIIDNTFGFTVLELHKRIMRSYVAFIADREMLILSESALNSTDKKHLKQPGSGLGKLGIVLGPRNRFVFLGVKYGFTFQDPAHFQLRSTELITVEPIQSTDEPFDLLTQRIQSKKH